MALPSAMTDAQRVESQRNAGLPEAPLLQTGAAWKQALEQSGPIPPQPGE